MDLVNDDNESLPTVNEATLEQSNEQLLEQAMDQQTRVFAVEVAQRACLGPDGHPSFLMLVARDVYLFVNGRDPVIDVTQKAGPNVIALSDHGKAIIDVVEDEDDDNNAE